MSATGAALYRDRLALVLGMLGSAYDGEIAAAGRRANALVRASGLTWSGIVAAAPRITSASVPANAWAWEVIDAALANCERLNAWEHGFVFSLAQNRRGHFSPRQLDKLAEIADKFGYGRGRS